MSRSPAAVDRDAGTDRLSGRRRSHALEVLGVATRLGLTSFGGPVAHLGYFRDEYVARRKWLDEPTYADLVALCQFLPGPASSQVGIAIGITRAGLLGGLAAWLGFTLPSAVVLVAFAYGLRVLEVADAGWLHGLKVAAVAVVALAVWGMARSLAPDRVRGTLARRDASLADVRLGAITLALPHRGLSDGSVEVSIRPEAIELRSDGNGPIRGTVRKAAYLGGIMEYSLDTDIGELFVVSTAVDRPLRTGAAVGVSLADHGVVVIPPGAASG